MVTPLMRQGAYVNSGANVRRSGLVVASVTMAAILLLSVTKYLNPTEIDLLASGHSAKTQGLANARIQALADSTTESGSGKENNLVSKLQTMWVSSQEKIGELEGEAAAEHSALATIQSKVIPTDSSPRETKRGCPLNCSQLQAAANDREVDNLLSQIATVNDERRGAPGPAGEMGARGPRGRSGRAGRGAYSLRSPLCTRLGRLCMGLDNHGINMGLRRQPVRTLLCARKPDP
jgi:hypothetical protein